MNTKLKCILIDDELPGLTYLKLLCEQIPELEVVKAFNDPEIFLNELESLDFDLCIFDIEMPGISGIELAFIVKTKAVIFTTAYKEYAVHAFDLDAIDYVVKPVKLERLQQAVNKVVHRINPKKQERTQLRMNTDKGNVLFFSDQLLYVRTSEIDSRDKTSLLENHTSLQIKNISFKKLISLLPEREFCRINKKELIALRTILYFSNDQISTTIFYPAEKPLNLTLGETYRAEFIKKLNEYSSNKK